MDNSMELLTRLLLLREFSPSLLMNILTRFFFFSTLICIPVGGELLPAVGGTAFVAFFGGILVLSLFSFLMARWACLDYRWKWNVKI